ncbi:P44/Msp2 family outer membrane protein, partial [Anaplasma phagocytophilum]|uniref:P44/Msp2 family outer membrane protein n=1 Tax=Anaplasma phagocytophilum TaxID=948 RepID=UPI000ABF1BCF
EADTVYLLAKELAYDVVNHQETRLATALAGYKGEDIVRFARAVALSAKSIDEKVCVTKKKATDGAGGFGEYAVETNADASNEKHNTSLCGGYGGSKSAPAQGGKKGQVLHDFAEKTLLGNESKNWPTSSSTADAVQKKTTDDNAKAVAKDLVQELTPEERTIVAGLLAKTIEGGEVVEIRAVSSTSVMVNACYDLLSEGLGVVPYACVGLGGNFVGVVDEDSTIRPSLTLYVPNKSLGKISAGALTKPTMIQPFSNTEQVCTVAL